MSPENRDYSRFNIELFQPDQRDSDIGSSMSSEGVEYNRNVLWGIGIAGVIIGGATLYLLRTERGRDLRSQVSNTVGDTIGQVQERVSEVMSQVKDSLIQLANRWNSEASETRDLNPATSGDRLRRVV